MLLQRAIVTFTLGPLVLLLIYLGSWYYFLAFSALLLIALIEFRQLTAAMGYLVPWWVLIPASVSQWLFAYKVQNGLMNSDGYAADAGAIALILGLLAALIYSLWLFETRIEVDAIGSWLATTTGIIVLGWLGAHFFWLRELAIDGAKWTALAMLSVWIADSAAYVVGKSIGRHKLAPRLSPNKTIEGYLGGVLAGPLFSTLIGVFLDLDWQVAVVVGLLISILSPAGDLGISMLKRRKGVKDSGNILPGHGGALDRTDSLLWAVVLTFYVVRFMI